MRRRMLDFLACPGDGAAPLEAQPFAIEGAGGADGEGEILEGVLRCPACGRWYPVHRGIPILLPDDLRGGPEEGEFRRRWGERLEAAGRAAPGARGAEGKTDEVSLEKRREIAKRDEESDLYDRLYPDELHTTERRDYDRLFPVGRDDVLLDAGCGTGRLTKDYVGRCREIVGTDFSFESLRRFRARLRPEERARVHLAQADVCRLPLRPEGFERILCTGVLCFVPWEEQRRAAVAGLHAVLKRGGIAAVNVYHHSWTKRLEAALGLGQANAREGYHSEGSCHYVNYTPREMRAWLGEFFEVRGIRCVYYRVPLLGRMRRLSDRLDGVLGRIRLLGPMLANELTAVVAKR